MQMCFSSQLHLSQIELSRNFAEDACKLISAQISRTEWRSNQTEIFLLSPPPPPPLSLSHSLQPLAAPVYRVYMCNPCAHMHAWVIHPTIKCYYSATGLAYPLRVAAVCVRPRLAAGQKIFDIFWPASKLHISGRNVSSSPPSRSHLLPPPPRRRPYQAAIICSCNLTGPFGYAVLASFIWSSSAGAESARIENATFLHPPNKTPRAWIMGCGEQFPRRVGSGPICTADFFFLGKCRSFKARTPRTPSFRAARLHCSFRWGWRNVRQTGSLLERNPERTFCSFHVSSCQTRSSQFSHRP